MKVAVHISTVMCELCSRDECNIPVHDLPSAYKTKNIDKCVAKSDLDKKSVKSQLYFTSF